MNNDNLLRAEDVARILGISRQSAYNLARSGAIRAVTFKATIKTKRDRMTVRFRREDLQEFIEANLREGGVRA